jgi:hypothetical protein
MIGPFGRTVLDGINPDTLQIMYVCFLNGTSNWETSLNQNEIDILCKSFPDEIVASTHWEPGSILIYDAWWIHIATPSFRFKAFK